MLVVLALFDGTIIIDRILKRPTGRRFPVVRQTVVEIEGKGMRAHGDPAKSGFRFPQLIIGQESRGQAYSGY